MLPPYDLRVEGFPYLILFVMRRRSVSILAIAHGGSDPEKWRGRTERNLDGSRSIQDATAVRLSKRSGNDPLFAAGATFRVGPLNTQLLRVGHIVRRVEA